MPMRIVMTLSLLASASVTACGGANDSSTTGAAEAGDTTTGAPETGTAGTEALTHGGTTDPGSSDAATSTPTSTSTETATATATSTATDSSDTGTEPSDEWLQVQGNRIVHSDGTPFHGRGANLFDERQCSSCSFAAPNPDGVDRWSDELIDNWHANFIRFDLMAKAAPYNEFELQWKSLVDDDAYFADIVQNIEHISSKPGAYVMVTLFADPSIKPENGEYDSEWPSSLGDSNARYTRLAEAFHDNPRVLFGLTNEPHGSADHDADLAAVYADAIAAIRGVEDGLGSPHHIVVVQAPGGYARDLSYFVANPLAGDQIAYEVHPYNPAGDFDQLLVQPHQSLPIIIGEYGPAGSMTDADIMALWTVAQANEIPYIAWSFHARCEPSMLQDNASDGCGLDAATGYDFPRTAWGDLLHDHLATPW